MNQAEDKDDMWGSFLFYLRLGLLISMLGLCIVAFLFFFN